MAQFCRSVHTNPRSTVVFMACIMIVAPVVADDESLPLKLTYQVESIADTGRFHRLIRDETWMAKETAVIVCDVWDLHHCLNAVRRLEQFAPRLDQLLAAARARGATIIHSPSDCMSAYEEHPARKRAVAAPPATSLPEDIAAWCSRIPAEEQAVYPIDQSDGGEDDDPAEHAEWAAKLKAMGRNPGTPWKTQSKLITIDVEHDYISDRGDEVWNILEQQGIKNVILTGVHTNMCVLGRPFGLRQMTRNGKRVVLMRDMTDTMYNPARWPYVSHFTGTDLVVSHVERYVCPTITSDQLLGGKPFRSPDDRRRHLAIVMAEDEYDTNRTLPEFASLYLGHDFRVSYVFGSVDQRNDIPGLEVLDDADVALFSIRRRVLKPEAMAIVRRFVEQGKPVMGIRTASHAFALRKDDPPKGYADWPEFDAQLFGGNYHNHHGNKLKGTGSLNSEQPDHQIVTGLAVSSFPLGGSLYQTSPLAKGATVIANGKVAGHPAEPIAWTFRRADGGRSFYSSLGHKDDFDDPTCVALLVNGLYWAAGLPPRDDVSFASQRARYEQQWSLISVPAAWETASAGVLKDYDGVAWYRCVVRVPKSWMHNGGLALAVPNGNDGIQAWFNGQRLTCIDTSSDTGQRFVIEPGMIYADDANLVTVRVSDRGDEGGLRQTPVLHSGEKRLELAGRWQFRVGDGPAWSNIPLPAKFGGSTDMFFEPR